LQIRVHLKYDPTGNPVIRNIERISRPGCRIYSEYDKMPRVLNNLGIVIVTTSKGVMTGKEAKMSKVGGELICKVW